MPVINIEKHKLAYAELRATGASFIVFEHDGHWYELRLRRYDPVPICGALKKTGDRCRSKDLHRGGKCKHHGGLSTGATTPEGKAKSLWAMRAGHKRWLMSKRVDQSARVAL